MHVGGYKLCTCVWLDALRLTHVSGSLRLFAAEPALRNTESVDQLTNRSFFSLQASGVKEPSIGKLLQEQKVKATYALNKWVGRTSVDPRSPEANEGTRSRAASM